MISFFPHDVTRDAKIMEVYTGSDFLEKSYGNNSVLIGQRSLLVEMSNLYTTLSSPRYSNIPNQIPVEFKKTDRADIFYDMSIPTYLKSVEDELIDGSGKIFAPKNFAETMGIEGKSIVLKSSIPKFNQESLEPLR